MRFSSLFGKGFLAGALAASTTLGLALQSSGRLPIQDPYRYPFPRLTEEQAEVLAHLSIVWQDNGFGDAVKTIRLSEANFQVVNGLGATDTADGHGNLIVGYNELGNLLGDARTGSHNIVGGMYSTFTSHGGLVVGESNLVTAPWASVCGGERNEANRSNAAVLGGYENVAGNNGAGGSGAHATVSGGIYNVASGDDASVTGGIANRATAQHASVTGGGFNTASALADSVTGGIGNSAGGSWSVVSGGSARSTLGPDDWVAGALFQDF